MAVESPRDCTVPQGGEQGAASAGTMWDTPRDTQLGARPWGGGSGRRHGCQGVAQAKRDWERADGKRPVAEKRGHPRPQTVSQKVEAEGRQGSKAHWKLSINRCVCTCMYAPVCACVCIHLSVYPYVYLHMCVHLCVYPCVYSCVHLCMCIPVCAPAHV